MAVVERDRELAGLRAAFDETQAGAPVTVLVAGDAGVGKSALVGEFAATLDDGARILAGECLDFGGSGLPFAPFTSLLRDLVGELGVTGVLRRLPGGVAGETGRLLPVLGPPPAGDTEQAKARLFEQLLSLMQVLAEERPTVLLIEDIHWADRSTRELLLFLVGNQRAIPALLIVLTYRTGLDRAHAARLVPSELARIGWVRRCELAPLSRRGVTAQLRELLGHEPDVDLSDDVFARSEGNPLFVEALMSCRDQRGPVVPQTIRDLLIAPLTLLPAPSQEVVRAASVCAVRIGHELLATVTGLDETELTAALRPAIAANLLVADDEGYRFRNALTREVVQDDLLPVERARLHVRYAEAIERDPALASPGRAGAQLAGHWGAVAGKHPARALSAAWHAAEAAGRSLAYAEQLHLLTEVLRLWRHVPGAEEHVGAGHDAVVDAAADAAAAAGDVTRALALVESLLAGTDAGAEPGRAGRMLMRRGELRHALGRPGGVEDLRAATTLIPETDPAAPAALVALSYRLLTVPREEEGRLVAEAAITAARRFGDVRAEVMATADLAYSRARAGDLDAQLPKLAQAAASARRLADDAALLHVLRREADVLQGEGRYAAAASVARTGLAVCAAAGLVRTAGPVHAANLAESSIAAGDWDEAAETIEHALGHPPIPGLDAYLTVLQGTILLAKGDLAGARTAAAYAREVFADGYPDTQDLLPLARLEIDLELAGRRPAEAAELVAEALSLPEVEASPRYLWPVLVSGAQLPGLRPRLRSLAETVPAIGPVQQAHRLTFAATVEPAQATWDRAAAAWADLGEPYPQARALLGAASVAGEAGAHADAVTRLRAAASLADRLGAVPLRAEIDRLAKALRVSPAEPGEPAPDRHSLTGREIEVLRLLAEGRTNRQIAAELYISAKTVSTHVSNILSKLDVSGRVQAATTAHRLGLLPTGGTRKPGQANQKPMGSPA
ncbi:helix-turn-helix transcriptional regulator [Amycolatopsis orientalis]|uniref:helix-turn-helix transcriptional regulator n=1 Tax=Amycolatopsis orientalis TaxID=31958 RepID=UPI0005CDE588|nr:helix-turn-helix transcriptional regulator [Amycolatopsis orientalis]